MLLYGSQQTGERAALGENQERVVASFNKVQYIIAQFDQLMRGKGAAAVIHDEAT